MKIFQLQNNTVQLEPEILLIPEFKSIYDRDKSKGKENAFADFCYIYFICDYNSPYRAYEPVERKEKVRKDYIKSTKWSEDSTIKAGIDKYNELTRTPSLGLLEDAYLLVNKLRGYFRAVDFSLMDERTGKPIYDAVDAMANLQKLGNVIESLKKLEDTVAKEKSEGVKTRGNVDVGYDER